MHTSRKRTLFTNAGLTTALTLSLCLLSGCNGARFLMGGDPSQPVNTSNTGTPSASSQAPSTLAISLNASLHGAPVEVASVRAFDALTGAPLEVKAGNVIAAGGGNVVAAGGGNYVVQQLSNINTGTGVSVYYGSSNAVNIVVTTSTGKKLSSLITTSGLKVDTTKVGSNRTTYDVKVNEKTTVAGQFARGPLKLMGSLKPEVAKDLVNNFLTALDDLTARLDKELDAATADQLIASVDDKGNITDGAKLNEFVKSSGLESQVNTTVNTATKSVAEKAADRSNVIKDVQVTAQDFAGTSYDIKIDGSKVVITNKDTGDVSIVDLTPSTTQDGVDGTTTTDPTTQDGVTPDANTTQGDPNVAPVYSDKSGFSPTITLTRSASSPYLTVKVQEYANQDNVLTIYSRVLKTDATLSLPAGAGATIQTGTSETVLADGTHKALQIKQGTVTTTDWSMLYNGGVTSLSNPTWQGHIQSLGGKNIADFLVYDQGSYYYLVTNYLSSSAITVNGPTTTLCTDVVMINSGAKVQSSLVSRNGKTVEQSNTL